jgi:hypothetical protein
LHPKKLDEVEEIGFERVQDDDEEEINLADWVLS